MKLVIMGPIGSGKGTQSKILAEKYGLTHLSTGDIMRKHIKDETEVGLQIKSVLDSGGYVNDDLTTELLKQSLTEKFILDGYPRTVNQVSLLDSLAKIDKVIYLEVDENEVIERLTLRYEETKREDDSPETVVKRLEIFKRETLPIIEIYEKEGKLVKVSGSSSVEEVTKSIEKVLL